MPASGEVTDPPAAAASREAAVSRARRAARITERGATRADDAFSETSMEDRKKEGYF